MNGILTGSENSRIDFSRIQNYDLRLTGILTGIDPFKVLHIYYPEQVDLLKSGPGSENRPRGAARGRRARGSRGLMSMHRISGKCNYGSDSAESVRFQYSTVPVRYKYRYRSQIH